MKRRVTIGRDDACDITLADESVSRRHAQLEVEETGEVLLADLGSSNGTFRIRGSERRRIERARVFAADRLAFGDLEMEAGDLLEIVRQLPAAVPGAPGQPVGPAPPVGSEPVAAGPPAAAGPPGPRSRLALREFVPLVGSFRRLVERGYLLPGVLLVAAIGGLMSSYGDPVRFTQNLGIAITVGMFFLVYRICGKRKPWYMVGGVLLAEWLLFVVPFLAWPFFFVFRTLPGTEPLTDSPHLLVSFAGNFVAAGLMEELMKMTPVFLLLWLTRRSKRADRSRWGVIEPLDAIVYGCAAAAMFVVVETLFQYVPEEYGRYFDAGTGEGDLGAALLFGGQLGIVRTLSAVTGHMAYSGYFGYFVGLGELRPAHRLRLWIGGWVLAAAVHGLHNASSGLLPLLLGVQLLALFLLVSSILAARKVSPTRDENFATILGPRRSRSSA